MRPSQLSFWLVLVLLGIVQTVNFGCAGKSVEDNNPGALYKEANDDINSDHYQMAIEKLLVVKNRFPYSQYALDAALRLADVYYMQESYLEAALAYQTFCDLHPRNSKVPYAMYRVGLSYYKDAPSTVARDLTDAQKAEDAFREYLSRFPNDSHAAEARKKLEDSRRMLADKELYIGNFYYKRGYYDSAKGRYEKLLELYPETKPAKEARRKLDKIEKENLHNEQ